MEDRIQNVLEPAERLAAKIQFAQARQMEAFHSFLLLGDAQARLRYRGARAEEAAAFDTLGVLTEDMSLQVKEEMANLGLLSFSWHLSHEEMLSQEVSTGRPTQDIYAQGFRQMLTTEQAAYAEVLSASRALRDALSVEMQLGGSEMARARFRPGPVHAGPDCSGADRHSGGGHTRLVAPDPHGRVGDPAKRGPQGPQGGGWPPGCDGGRCRGDGPEWPVHLPEPSRSGASGLFVPSGGGKERA